MTNRQAAVLNLLCWIGLLTLIRLILHWVF